MWVDKYFSQETWPKIFRNKSFGWESSQRISNIQDVRWRNEISVRHQNCFFGDKQGEKIVSSVHELYLQERPLTLMHVYTTIIENYLI